jgi:hypothetical protein
MHATKPAKIGAALDDLPVGLGVDPFVDRRSR